MKSRAYTHVRETERVHIREKDRGERPREECLLASAGHCHYDECLLHIFVSQLSAPV